MTLEYAAVARENIILAQYASASGNFDIEFSDIFKKMNKNEGQFACEKKNKKFFILHDASGLNFIVVGAIELDQPKAFEFLKKLQRNFLIQHTRSWQNAEPFSLQNEFSPKIKSLLIETSSQKFEQIQRNLSETQDTMSKNIQNLMLRGNELELLDSTANELSNSSVEFVRTSASIKRQMFCQKYSLWFIIAGIAVVVIFLVIIIVCGIKFNKC